jgi:hypothetical protein
VAAASRTTTEQPARASSIAAASPFGPAPTTTASCDLDAAGDRSTRHELYALARRLASRLPGCTPAGHIESDQRRDARAARRGVEPIRFDGEAAPRL